MVYHSVITVPLFLQNSPLLSIGVCYVFTEPYKYQLRTYIYQARDILAMDDSGMSDPFARVSFLTQSMRTENIKKSLCPTWDQSLIFEEIEIHGDPRGIEAQPPDIYIELFDHDTFVSLRNVHVI